MDKLQQSPATKSCRDCPRPDGRQYRQRVDYCDAGILVADEVEPDDLWSECFSPNPTAKRAARKRIWRRLRNGYYSRPRRRRKPPKFPVRSPVPKKQRPLCGAKCRDGHPCQARVAWNPYLNKMASRCRLHGGLSTGPKTDQGKAASLDALNRSRGRNG